METSPVSSSIPLVKTKTTGDVVACPLPVYIVSPFLKIRREPATSDYQNFDESKVVHQHVSQDE
jgi:hypothetical protein